NDVAEWLLFPDDNQQTAEERAWIRDANSEWNVEDAYYREHHTRPETAAFALTDVSTEPRERRLPVLPVSRLKASYSTVSGRPNSAGHRAEMTSRYLPLVAKLRRVDDHSQRNNMSYPLVKFLAVFV